MIDQLASPEWWRHAQLWTLAIGLAAFWAMEGLWPVAGQRRFLVRLAHTGHNLAIWLIGAVFISLLAGNLYGGASDWLDSKGVGVLHFVALPFWLTALVAFLLLDLGDYVFHRLSHRSRALWLLHAVHHSDLRVDVSTNLRQHPVHVLCTIAWKIVAFAAIGAPLSLAMARECLVIAIAHLHHAGIPWPRWIDLTIGRVFISPRAHWLHHSPQSDETDSNFGTTLVLWDRLFGTYVDPLHRHDAQFGLSGLRERQWQTAWGMLLTPWRARRLERL